MHPDGPTPAVWPEENKEKIEPMSLPVGGKMRKGVFYETSAEVMFFFVEQGALSCWRLKIGENGIRATAELFAIPWAVLVKLDQLKSLFSWVGSKPQMEALNPLTSP